SPLAPDYRYDSTKSNTKAQLNPKNQLPPVVQVTMVAIDEKSANLLTLDESKWDLFGVSGKFKQTKDFSNDLLSQGPGGTSLESELIKRKVAYRVFTTNV